MWDIAYVLITLLFFAAMLWYVSGCERLGANASRRSQDDQPASGWRNGQK